MKWLTRIRDQSVIRRSGQFDGGFYLKAYPDVRRNPEWSKRPLKHFVHFGAAEGRTPRPGFDTEFYLRTDPDLKESGINPFSHYLRTGYREGRAPNTTPDFFSEWGYFNRPIRHVDLSGQIRNWRDAWKIKKSHRFSPEWYWSQNPDVLAAVEKSFWWKFRKSGFRPLLALSKAITHPIRHFVWHGMYEGRQPSTEFDLRFYIRQNADVRLSGLNPFVHYLKFGIHENRPTLDRRNFQSHETGLEISGSEASQSAKDAGFSPKVSVIVPNFNHGPYLKERLESIYQQSYENLEIILLDDSSTDQSQDILRQYAEKYPSITHFLCNEVNSGNVFRQWAKGIELAAGELIWIAESDDFCDLDFLEKLVDFFRDEAVTLAYSNVSFVNERGRSLNDFAYEHYLAPVDAKRWQKSHTATGFREVGRAFGVLNLIPNTSGCVFRKPSDLPLLQEKRWLELRICGDWIFYLHLIRNGKVSYSADTKNYYRFHGDNASSKTYGDATYYQEHEFVARTLIELYGVPDDTLERHAEGVRTFWRRQASSELKTRALEDFYDLERIRTVGPERASSIMIALYSFSSGGGEVLPIRLANALYKKGFGVIVLEYLPADRNVAVRKMLNSGIPVVSCSDTDTLRRYIRDFGIGVFNSHHPSLQHLFCDAFPGGPRPRHVSATHGLLDTLTRQELSWCMDKFDSGTDHWVYVGDKNLIPFKSFDLYKSDRFTKLPNGMERPAISPISRRELGISESAFVLCLVSRAMEEKGWSEAIEVVSLARRKSGRDVRLLLVGDGEEYDRLGKASLPEHIHLLGFRANPLDYYAASDMGFLPSRYRAETFPLTIIEAFFAGRPVIASDIGEISQMLDAGGGELAGALFPLHDWRIPVKEVAAIISEFAANPSALSRAAELARQKSTAFEIGEIAERYAALLLGDVEGS